MLDDGATHTITILPPTLSSSFTWQIPVPPTGPVQASGFVPVGTAVGQMLAWTGSQWGTISPITNYWQRSGTTLSPTTTGDNISTSGQLQLGSVAAGISSFSTGAQGGSTINYVLPTSQGAASSLTMLSNDGTGSLSWSNPTLFARKTTAQSPQTYNTTGLVNDNALAVSVAANQTYTIDCFLSLSDPGATGAYPEVGFAAPAGSTLNFGFLSPEGVFSANLATVTTATGTPCARIPITTSSVLTFVHIKGILITAGSAGTLQLQAQCASAATSFQMNANSYMQVTRVQ